MVILAVACAVTVSNIYFPQPLLEMIGNGFGVSEQVAGLIVSFGQLGYALGLLLVVPLGDTANLRRLALLLPALTTAGLVVAAVSPNVATLAVATIALSTTTVLPQVIVPMAATMAGPDLRGRVLAKVGIGLTLGIVLSRTFSGVLSEASGSWRTSYLAAAVLTAGIAVVLPRWVPERAASERPVIPYRRLLTSLPGLLATHPEMRLSAWLGATLFAVYSAFWATVTFHLAGPAFHLGAAYAGTLGLLNLPGTLLAARGGSLCDRYGSSMVNLLSLVTVGLSLGMLLLGQHSLVVLIVASNVLSFGCGCGAIANQARIFGLPVDIRARLNTVYMVSSFVGAALGSLVGTAVYGSAGWSGMLLVSVAFLAVATAGLVISRLPLRVSPNAVA